MWKEKFRSCADDNRCRTVAAVSIALLFFYLADFGFLEVLVISLAGAGGFFLTEWLFGVVSGQLLFTFFNGSDEHQKKKRNDDLPETDEEKRKKMPWEGLEVPLSLNQALESLLNEIVEQYVNNWYQEGISRDLAFLNEIRFQLRYACANLLKSVQKVDLAKFITEEAIPTASLHATRTASLEKEITAKQKLPRSMVESKIAELLTDVHVAVMSRDHETRYVKQIADFLVPRLLDDTRLAGRAYDDDSPMKMFGGKNEKAWPSRPMRSFIRELVANGVLLPMFDAITQPDMINYWLILAFDEKRQAAEWYVNVDSTPTQFLHGLLGSTVDVAPDSFLQLKLSEIIRDARLFGIFKIYLRDVKGPTHELEFLAETTRILDSMHRKTESESQIAYDIWQLYGQFIHESAPDQVVLSQEIVDQYKSTVEKNDVVALEHIVETSYQVVYRRMQNEHVVLFCQSECFLGFLCGSPPITINELIDVTQQEKRAKESEPVFSISQLRARVRKALTSMSEDPEVEKAPQVESPESDSFVNVPSIDVICESDSTSESAEVVGTNTSTTEDDVIKAARLAEKTGGLVMDTDTRDLNSWKVHVSKVAAIRDAYNEKTIFMFVIDVERPFTKSHETKKWSIYRSFNEFYVLESKLNEFHGDALRFAALPPRKTFATRDRPFFEQHRLIFDTFVVTLCQHKNLNRSDLLLTFLSSNDEFRDNLMLSDLNPWKVVKKMPGKLSREKGQNLRPFLLKTLAGVLAPTTVPPNVAPKEKTSSTDSIEDATTNLATNAVYSTVFGNNFAGIAHKSALSINQFEMGWTRSSLDAILLYVFNALDSTSNVLTTILATMKLLFQKTFDVAFQKMVKKGLEKGLSVENLVYMVQHLQYVLFVQDITPATEQEKEMREELAKRMTLEFSSTFLHRRTERIVSREDKKSLIINFLDVLQYPRLNKQLFYVLLDQLLVKMFPELDVEDIFRM